VRPSTRSGRANAGVAALNQTPLALSLSKGALGVWATVGLAACSAQAPADEPAAEQENLIECAVAGAAAFARECRVQQTQTDGAPTLVVRHPDGGFRRFEILSDGTGLATADGAQPADVSLHEDGIEVAVGTDRYRFPATIAGDARR
jgi:hypothetical protein